MRLVELLGLPTGTPAMMNCPAGDPVSNARKRVPDLPAPRPRDRFRAYLRRLFM
jgi:hypothetical protein